MKSLKSRISNMENKESRNFDFEQGVVSLIKHYGCESFITLMNELHQEIGDGMTDALEDWIFLIAERDVFFIENLRGHVSDSLLQEVYGRFRNYQYDQDTKKKIRHLAGFDSRALPESQAHAVRKAAAKRGVRCDV